MTLAPTRAFAANQQGTFAPPSFAGLSAFTVELWFKPSSLVNGHIVRIGSPTDGTTHKMRLRMTSAGAIQLDRTVGTATQSSVSAAAVLASGTWAHIVAVFPANADHALYVNGAAQSLTHTGSALNGALSVASTDELAIGDPSPSSITGAPGDYGRVTMWPTAFGAQRAAVSYRHQADFTRWVGSGAENRISDTNLSPVAVPLRATATAGTATTIDVRPTAYDPNSGDTLSVVAGSASVVSGSGSVTITSGNLVFTPSSSFTGEAVLGYTLRDTAGKQSTGRVYVTVRASTGARKLIDYPFNRRAAHHRPIGAGRQFYRAGGVHISDYAATPPRRNTYGPDGALNDMSDLQRIGSLILGNDGSGQGRKFCFEVGSDATLETWNDRDSTATVRCLTPKLQTTRGGPLPYIARYTGADFENGWAPLTADGTGIGDADTGYFMQRFNQTNYDTREYTSENSFDMRLTDNYETPGGLTGGGGMKWPGCVLRGHDVNDPNPGPINHALHCTGTRKPEDAIAAGFTQADFDNYACLLSKEILWPCSRVDGSVNPYRSGYNAATAATQNTGPFPYGSLFCIDHNDYDTIAALIGTSNKRGLRILECFVCYGMYLFDGQNDIVVRSGKPRGVMKIRIDGLVGQDKFGTKIDGVEDDIVAALDKLRPYLKIIGNRLKYNDVRAEDAPNGLPYVGGSKTVGGRQQWVLDAANPAKSLNDAYDAPSPGYYVPP